MALDPSTALAHDESSPSRRGWPAERLRLAGLLVAATLLYGFGIRTAFLSDTWAHLGRWSVASLQQALADYVPHLDVWYRPTTDFAYWLLSHLFGTDPLPYHLVALAAWLLTIALLHQLALRLTGRPWAAIAGAAVFATSIHAHEPLWDVAVLHLVLLAPVLVGSLLAALAGRWRLTTLLVVLALSIDEAGLLCLPLLLLLELIGRPSDRRSRHDRVRDAARRTLPIVAVITIYFASRLATGGFHAEGAGANAVSACHTRTCLEGAAIEYTNRLAVRGDLVLAQIWSQGRLIFLALAALALLVALVLQPWRWRVRGPLLFALAWIAGTCVFFAFALWPYIADRFMYLPDIGMGLLAAVLVAGVLDSNRSWSRPRRSVVMLLGAAGAVWVLLGGLTLVDRAGRWVEAGDQGTAVLRNLEPYLRAAPPSSVVVVLGAPDLAARQNPPGSSGPLIFHNGLPEACVLVSGRSDLTIVTRLDDVPTGTAATYLQISGTHVTQLSERPPG